MTRPLSEIRKDIDSVDENLANLLVKRADLAREVRNFKKGSDVQVYHPARERQILERAYEICEDSGFSQKAIENIFLSVISACRTIVGDIEICIPENLGGFAHSAVFTQFGPIDQVFFVKTISEVFSRVEEGASQYGIVPVSYSNEGVCGETLFSFLTSNQTIAAEIYVKNEYSIFSNEASLDDVDDILIEAELFSALKFPKNSSGILKKKNIIPVMINDSNELCFEKGSKKALFLPQILSTCVSMPCLLERVEGITNVESRYFVIGKQENATQNHNTTALIFVIKDQTGALRDVLLPFEKLGVPILLLESRTSPHSSWECFFYIEVEGSKDSKELQEIFTELNNRCSFIKILGSFSRTKK
jgi:chorismate mutase/prephenate dehydratase